MKRKTPFAHHALERVCERYGVRLTRKQQLAFGRMLSNPKYTISLTNNRLACYFEGNWYLLAYTASLHKTPTSTGNNPMTVLTFLRLEDASEDDKWILCHDKRYLKINNDAFHVLSVSSQKPIELPPQSQKSVELPDLTDEEMPHDEIRSAENILKAYCDRKH